MKYDFVIFGGGTAGVAAGYIAGKAGLKTLIVEKSDVLGGSITRGLVVPSMKTDHSNINTDFLNDLIKAADAYGAVHTYTDDNPCWFNPELLKIVFDEMLESQGVEVFFNSEPVQILNYDGFEFLINHKGLSLHIESKYILDATGDAEIFRLLNCELQKKSEKKQLPSLRFIVSDIDTEKFSSRLLETDKDRNVTSMQLTGSQIYLSTACTYDKSRNWALYPLFEQAVKAGELTERDASYFQVFSIPSMPTSLAFNCPRIFPEGDISDVRVYSKALISGRKSVFRIFNFCKKHFPGFENASISHISDFLGVRESYRIKGKYTLTKDDIINNKKFENIAFTSDYPVDIHSGNGSDTLEFTNHTYSVPIECLISEKYDNLYAAGRIISADFEAQSAVRTQINCFSMGEAVAKDIIKKLRKQF